MVRVVGTNAALEYFSGFNDPTLLLDPYDIILGRGGRDIFTMAELDHADVFRGGRGRDEFKGVTLSASELDYAELAANLRYDGGPGIDKISIRVDVDQSSVIRIGGLIGNSTSVEERFVHFAIFPGGDALKAIGTNGDDLVFVSVNVAVPDVVRLDLKGGNDIVNFTNAYEAGRVFIETGSGRDKILLGADAEKTVVDSGQGADTIRMWRGNFEKVMAGRGDDLIFLSGHGDFYGNLGTRKDIVDGGQGADRFVPDLGYDNGRIRDFDPEVDQLVFDSNKFDGYSNFEFLERMGYSYNSRSGVLSGEKEGTVLRLGRGTVLDESNFVFDRDIDAAWPEIF